MYGCSTVGLAHSRSHPLAIASTVYWPGTTFDSMKVPSLSLWSRRKSGRLFAGSCGTSTIIAPEKRSPSRIAVPGHLRRSMGSDAADADRGVVADVEGAAADLGSGGCQLLQSESVRRLQADDITAWSDIVGLKSNPPVIVDVAAEGFSRNGIGELDRHLQRHMGRETEWCPKR